jgi:tetratricopeptide (TPR) repeat protein
MKLSVRKKSCHLLLVFIVLCWVGCDSRLETQPVAPDKKVGTILFEGFAIPNFPSASEQLAYAKTRVANPLEKVAALKFVIKHFPYELELSARAKMELAYLEMGVDFRLAKAETYHLTLSKYEKIIHDYGQLKGICAQAYWYMGWIYTDLLQDTAKGISMYRQVAENYPNEKRIAESTVPWLTLVYPDTPRKKTLEIYDRQTYSWAELALLEIVRNSPYIEERHEAFMQLWSRDPVSLSTGHALLALLKSEIPDNQIAAISRAYILHNTPNTELDEDIRWALSSRLQGGHQP